LTATMAELYDKRTAPRHSVNVDGTLRDDAHRPYEIVVADLSLTGFRIPGSANLDVFSRIGLGLTGLGGRSAQVVRQDEQGWFGCVFDVPLTASELKGIVAGQPKSTVVPLPQTSDLSLEAPSYSYEAFSPRVKAWLVVATSAVLWSGLVIFVRVCF
jgi:hypothetical protein